MLIAPIIFCTVVGGIAHMADMAKVGRVAIKALLYFEVITTFALIIGLVAVNVWQPGAGMNIDPATINASVVEPYVKQTSAVGFVPFLMNIIPQTFVGAFAEGNILQVLFISVLCGFALIWLGERAKPVTDVVDAAGKMVFGIVRHRDVGGAARCLRRHRVHGRQVRHRLAVVARPAGRRLLHRLHHLHRRRARPDRGALRLQPVEADPLHQGRNAGLHRHHLVGDGAAAHHRQDGSGRLRAEHRRARDPDRLFLQSRRHLPLSRDRRGVPGAGHQHPSRYRAIRSASSSSCW